VEVFLGTPPPACWLVGELATRLGARTIGRPTSPRTVTDAAPAGHDEMGVAGGIPHVALPTTYRELLVVTGGTAALVAR
jgi:hypothetical protein